ncbi:MAG TPA: universal stress protein [Amnibacterium sp.]|jgi:nucleotide-binding universal stress UspA family protein|nr:universal stress protein [Amnibacterium sp.]
MAEAAESRELVEPVIVVGVLPDQPLWVVQVAGEFARTFHARLVCVTVDATRYVLQDLPDGTLISAPIDPETGGDEPVFPPERLDEIEGLLAPMNVRWSMRELVGEAATSLMSVADEENALMIVVGTRQNGFTGAVRRFFGGSVAVRLSHRQYRPVVVVPIAPAEDDRRMPWDADDVVDRPHGRHGGGAPASPPAA